MLRISFASGFTYVTPAPRQAGHSVGRDAPGSTGYSMPVSIRLATLGDIPALQRMIPESVRVLGGNYYSPRQIESALIYIFGVDSQLILDGTYFVAESGEHLVGCGGWSKRRTMFGGDQSKSGNSDELLEPAKDPARIRAFFVHPQWSRKGIGSRIVRACEEAGREAGFTSVELVATLPGEPLYLAMGYRVMRRLEIPMPDGERLPAAHMEKRLQ